MRYLVRCAHCDRAFWLDAKESPLPEHGPWDRRTWDQPREASGRCVGSGAPGYWIGEGEGPLSGWQ